MSDTTFTPPAEPHPVRLAGTLGLAGLLSGLLLVMVYEATLPQIERNRAEAVRRAVLEVVPGSATMQMIVWRDGAFAIADGTEDPDTPAIHAAYDADDRFCGYAIRGAGAGFQDTISLIYGFDPTERRIIGMRVLESRETPGLGDKIDKPAFRSEFDALAVEPQVTAVKAGTAAQPNEIDAITGATISSKAIVRIVNATNAEWLARLPAPGEELPLREDRER